ncbi:mechanosensitive ion channel family protein [Nocardia sp. CA-145437]|uniref:mechanosensitive ion channel family protein n=1 Tax=Nocardia sp. CA-145437 TaxID=3239980 RepID=UPI003D95E546
MHTSSSAIDIQIGRGLSDAWSSIATWLPKFVGFLVILLIGWFVAKLVARLVTRILHRVGFDRLVERGGIKEMLARGRYDATGIIAKLAYYAVLLITLQLGFGVFGPNPVSTMLNAVVAWLPRLAVGIIIVCIAGAIARVVQDMVSNMLSGLDYGRMLGRIAAVFIWGIGIIAALNQIGVGTSVTMPILITVLATVGGILVVGIGGGLIRPMQQRWSGWLDTIEGEMPEVKGHAQAYQRGREDAARQRQAQEAMAAQRAAMAQQPTMAGQGMGQMPPGKWAEPGSSAMGYGQQGYQQGGYQQGGYGQGGGQMPPQQPGQMPQQQSGQMPPPQTGQMPQQQTGQMPAPGTGMPSPQSGQMPSPQSGQMPSQSGRMPQSDQPTPPAQRSERGDRHGDQDRGDM